VRRITRFSLDDKTRDFLYRKQKQTHQKLAEGTLDSSVEWDNSRKTKGLKYALATLQKMMGEHQRCMYCLDSHGSDIEHFRPKSLYPKRMFKWRNFLLCCTECGRIKGNQFPLQGRKPLLIDPSKEQPWLYIDFDPETGNLVARFDPVTGDYSVKGESTVTTLKLDQREVLAVGYKKAFTRLTRKVQRFLEDSIDANQLLLKLQEEDDHGLALLGWVFLGTGKTVDPFKQLQTFHPEVYSDLSKAMNFP
jgi:uncharacterized protein (TIGR02646 family)